jgi:hypothetical protein
MVEASVFHHQYKEVLDLSRHCNSPAIFDSERTAMRVAHATSGSGITVMGRSKYYIH